MSAVCAAPGQLDCVVALTLQQHGEQSALRKGRGQFSHNVFSFPNTFEGLVGSAYGTLGQYVHVA